MVACRGRRINLIGITLCFLSGITCGAAVKLPGMFTDGMVLQRDAPAAVWGWADPGEKITVSFAKQVKKTEADAEGLWIVWLDPLAADKNPETLTVSGASSASAIKDVVVGEVWLCSGQSNMGWPLKDTEGAAAAIATLTNGLIRCFTAPPVASLYPHDDIAARWTVCNPNNAVNCSALAYYFARELTTVLDVPVGLLVSAWSGTTIFPWVNPEGLRSVPELAGAADNMEAWIPTSEAGQKAFVNYLDLMQAWIEARRKVIGKKSMPPPQPLPPGWHPYLNMQATTIYNGMIHPLKSYAIRGAIWYQGESDAHSGLDYYPRMQALIKGWRQAWRSSRQSGALNDFPFYYVQLPAYGQARANNPAGGDGWTLIREAQLMAMTITNTGMACAIDIGGIPPDLHPRNKLDVGRRLALWALAKTYCKDVVFSGPIYRECKVEGDKIRVSFDYADNGLMAGEKSGLEPAREAKDKKLNCFAIAGEDKAWHRADAMIENNTVVVSCAKVPKPAAVRYAYSGNPEGANLYNTEGLPAVPFRTDQWP